MALALAKELPGVEEGMAYGTPAFRVKGRFMARLKEDARLIVQAAAAAQKAADFILGKVFKETEASE